jgi:hypothetical protein
MMLQFHPRRAMRLIASVPLVGLSIALTALPASAQGQANPAAAATSANPDWPCIQHKQPILTAAQMWDGPPIVAEGARSDNDAIRKLVPVLISRRIAMDDAEKAIKAFADAQEASSRDARLTELFAAVLAEINQQRSSIVDGIEKFQRRQLLRAGKLEADGTTLADLNKAAEANLKDQEAARRAEEAQSRYDWDARVFQERQQNVPIACEIPVLIEQRAFALAQAIRNLMAN